MITTQSPERTFRSTQINTSNYRVVLVCNFRPDNQESILRYGDMLFASLKERGVKVSMLQPEAKLSTYFHNLPAALRKWVNYVDKLLIFPKKLQKFATQSSHSRERIIYHIVDHGNAPYRQWIKKQPHIITCHDALAIRSARGEIPENQTKWSGRILQNWILGNLRESNMVVCVSRQTERELRHVGRLDEERTTVIPHTLNYPYKPLAQEIAQIILLHLWQPLGGTPPANYFFHVGGTQWYKNREGLLEIYAQIKDLDPEAGKLVIAGKPNTESLAQGIQDLGLSGDVIYVGEVTCEQLNALYSRANALLFPSLAEGFGWPILEAQAAGCPVFTTNAHPMSEIGGNAASYIDPRKPREAAELILRQLPHRAAMARHGILNASKYSRDTMIEAYMRLYERISKKQGTARKTS